MLEPLFRVVEGSKILLTETGQQVPAFQRIIDKYPEEAEGMLAYVYHMVSPKSPYYAYGEDKEKTIREEYLPGRQRMPKEVKQAILVYESFRLPEQILLDGFIESLMRLAEFYKTIDFTEMNDKGEPLHNPNQVMNSMKSAGQVMQQLEILREQVRKGLEKTKEYRGNAQPNMFDEQLM